MNPSKLAKIHKDKTSQALDSVRHNEQLAYTAQVSQTVLTAISSLIQYLEGHTTKTEVVNQLQSIGTPDVKFVVQAIEILDESVRANKPDYSTVVDAIQQMVSKIEELPKEYPEFVQRESVSVSNLEKVESSIEEVKKAVEALDLHVEGPTVNVAKPDLKPLETSIASVVSAVKAIVIPKPESPYTNRGKSVKVELQEDGIPVTQVNQLITEKFDEYTVDYDDFGDFDDEQRNDLVSAIRYFYKTKKVATLTMKYDKSGRFIGAKKS